MPAAASAGIRRTAWSGDGGIVCMTFRKSCLTSDFVRPNTPARNNSRKSLAESCAAGQGRSTYPTGPAGACLCVGTFRSKWPPAQWSGAASPAQVRRRLRQHQVHLSLTWGANSESDGECEGAGEARTVYDWQRAMKPRSPFARRAAEPGTSVAHRRPCSPPVALKVRFSR